MIVALVLMFTNPHLRGEHQLGIFSAMAYASVAATLGILFSLFPAGLDGSGLGSANSWLARHFSCEAEVFTHAHP
jgi:hypothetical protein